MNDPGPRRRLHRSHHDAPDPDLAPWSPEPWELRMRHALTPPSYDPVCSLPLDQVFNLPVVEHIVWLLKLSPGAAGRVRASSFVRRTATRDRFSGALVAAVEAAASEGDK